MTVYLKWRHALALVESGDDPNGSFGDAGQALGRWQMHPAFVWQWGPDEVGLSETWDQVCAAALLAFYTARSKESQSALYLAMEFHLGVEAVREGKWDEGYAESFTRYYATTSGTLTEV